MTHKPILNWKLPHETSDEFTERKRKEGRQIFLENKYKADREYRQKNITDLVNLIAMIFLLLSLFALTGVLL